MNALITYTHMCRHMCTHTLDLYGYDVFVILQASQEVVNYGAIAKEIDVRIADLPLLEELRMTEVSYIHIQYMKMALHGG